MDLFVTRFVFHLHLREVDELFQPDFAIAVDIKSIEGRVKDIECKFMVWFDELEVLEEPFPSDLLIFIFIISSAEKLFDVIVTNFWLSNRIR